jgi:hypothetical protein
MHLILKTDELYGVERGVLSHWKMTTECHLPIWTQISGHEFHGRRKELSYHLASLCAL